MEMTNKTLLWLDDIRNPYITYHHHVESLSVKYGMKWTSVVWARSYDEFVSYLTTNGIPDVVSFDHDLGEGPDGYDCAKFLVNMCIENNVDAPKVASHSSNPPGRDNILKLFEGYGKFRKSGFNPDPSTEEGMV